MASCVGKKMSRMQVVIFMKKHVQIESRFMKILCNLLMIGWFAIYSFANESGNFAEIVSTTGPLSLSLEFVDTSNMVFVVSISNATDSAVSLDKRAIFPAHIYCIHDKEKKEVFQYPPTRFSFEFCEEHEVRLAAHATICQTNELVWLSPSVDEAEKYTVRAVYDTTSFAYPQKTRVWIGLAVSDVLCGVSVRDLSTDGVKRKEDGATENTSKNDADDY